MEEPAISLRSIQARRNTEGKFPERLITPVPNPAPYLLFPNNGEHHV